MIFKQTLFFKSKWKMQITSFAVNFVKLKQLHRNNTIKKISYLKPTEMTKFFSLSLSLDFFQNIQRNSTAQAPVAAIISGELSFHE